MNFINLKCSFPLVNNRLNGSYEALDGGFPFEAMVDFTGGITERYDLGDKTPQNLFKILLKASERSSLLTCVIQVRKF